MKVRAVRSLAAFALVLLLPVLAAGGWDPAESRKVERTIDAFKKKDSTLTALFDKAYGYAVFPSVIKGAIGIGGAHGKGQVFRAGKLIGRAALSQGSIGFQLGGQSYSKIVFFQDEAVFDRFKSGNLKFAAQASAIAVTAGVAANVAYEKGVSVFTLGKMGLMFDASIGAQHFSFKPH